MSCGHENLSCVCSTLEFLADLQDQVVDNCATGCFNPNALVSPTTTFTTVPFILYTKKGTPFAANSVNTTSPFSTIFFKVEEVDVKNCCATLSLIRINGYPSVYDMDFDEVDLSLICNVTTADLMTTKDCITVDLDCFCAIQCLPAI